MEVDSCMGYYLSPTLSYLPARSFSNCHPPPYKDTQRVVAQPLGIALRWKG